MPDNKSLSQLTRSLMLGASVGTLAMVQVGCTIPAASPAGGSDAIRAASEGEAQLCRTALASRAPADVNALLRAHPDSQCIAPLLTALPRSTLSALSADALRGLSPAVRRSIPASVRAQLPLEPTAPVTTARADRNIDDSAY